MKILFLTQYFPPEVGAAASRAFETVKHFRNLGHDVTVLTTFPNYLLSKPIEKYKGKIDYYEQIDEIKIYRSYIYSNFNKSLIGRFFTFLSFMFSSIIKSICLPNHDVIIASSPPFSIGISGFIISKIKCNKFIFEVRDLYPDSAIELGIIKNKLLIKILRKIENFLYKKSHMLVALTKGILCHFQKLGHKKKSILITNGVDTELFSKTKPKGPNIRLEKNCFIIINVGILGRIHSLETLLKAIALTGKDDIFTYFIGDGVEKEKLQKLVSELSLKNVYFLTNQKKEHIPYLISQSDLCIATTKKLDLTKGTLPVKIFEYMACGKPILAAVHGEAEHLITEAKAGIVVEPENYKQMAKEILKFYNNPALLKKMGENGKKFVFYNYSREKLVAAYSCYLKKLQ